MKTLTRYIGREVLSAILLIFSALVILFAFFDLINELGDVGRGSYTITSALLTVSVALPSVRKTSVSSPTDSMRP